MKRLLSSRLIFGVIGAVVGVALGLAITGGYPDGVQDPLANFVKHAGINLPGGADVHPKATFAPEERNDIGNAFPVPEGGGAEEATRRSRSGGTRTGSSCYENEACRRYFGLETDDPNEPQVVFVPPEDTSGRHNPGTQGEPGQPGIPEGDNDDPGESDGTPGQGGPPGDPG